MEAILQGDKKRLADLLGKGHSSVSSPTDLDYPLLKKSETREYYPLSSTQKRLFVLQQLEESSTMYHLPIALIVEGPLDFQRLQQAIDQVIQRHDIFRASFEMKDGIPIQKIADTISFKIAYEEIKEEKLSSYIQSFVKPFDFQQPCLLHITAIKMHSHRHCLLIDMHHLIADGASLNQFLKETMLAYQGLPLSTPPIQYKDFAVWQQELLSSRCLEKQKNYWLKQLKESPVLHLPYDFPRPPIQISEGNQVYFDFDNSLTQSLKQLAAKQNVSLYMLLMAIYQVLLYRYSYQEDIIVGSSIEGRHDPMLQSVLGLFINTLPIRGKPSPFKLFTDFLAEIKETCCQAYENQMLPFGEIIDLLSLKRDISRNPLFDTHFDFHDARHTLTSAGELVFQPLTFPCATSKFDLSLEGIERKEGIHFYFEYCSALFKQSTIEKMIAHFRQIAEELVKNPSQSIYEIHLLTQADQQALFEDFQSFQSEDNFVSFVTLFSQCVQQIPDRIAIVCENLHLTYRELDRKSSQLAAHLLKQGFATDMLALLVMDRNAEFLISVLGIFKAGGGYIPIDPFAPQERIDQLIEESHSVFLLTDQKIDGFNSQLLENRKCWNVADLFLELECQNRSIHPCQLAYAIFTSGSTGKPKGVMVEHQGMVNHLFLKRDALKLSENDVVAQTSSQTFDVSVWQFLVASLVGAKVVVFKQEYAWNPPLLLELLEKEKITVFETVPSHMHLILEELESNKNQYSLDFLKWLMLNGEALTTHLVNRWFKLYAHIPVMNAYGPTECSDDVTHYIIQEPIHEKNKYVFIGNILDNLASYVLDPYLMPVPIGIYGTLYIGGIGVARGYLNAPDKTATSFLPCPFKGTSIKHSRMYVTGDVTRYLPDGNLDYMGRQDNQVKIRGQRIELNEIESVLNEHEMVQQAVIAVYDHPSLDVCLSAYIVKKGKGLELPSSDYLKQIYHYLEHKLPKSFIPTAFVLLDHLPLLPNGKINRKALPTPTDQDYLHDEQISLPRTQTEKTLASVWSDILKIKKIGLQDDFFHLGGHSLLATQLVSRIAQTFGVKISLRNLFEFPNLEQLSLLIDNQLRQKIQDFAFPTVISDKVNRYQPFPLTQVQQAYWIGRKGIFDLGDVSVHIYSEYDSTTIDIKRLEKAWNLLIQRHEALRLIINEQGLQQILEQVPYYPIHIYDLEHHSHQQLDEIRLAFSHEVFPSEKWPLFRIAAARLRDKIRLYLSFDALVIDGWSVEILFSEWIKLYQNLEENLPSLELSFRDYVLTLEHIKTGDLYQSHKHYWLSRLAHFPLAPPLPLVSSPQEISKQTFQRASDVFPKSLWEQLQQNIKEFNLSPTGLLSAIFAEVLYEYSGSHHFALNLTLFDRLPLHPQINEIAGDFTSLTLLEIDYRQTTTCFLDRAKQVQEQLWRDLDHQLYSGVEFLRELSHHYSQFDSGNLMPVVLTSILGGDNQYQENIQHFFGTEVYSISQTPQVWLDYKAYEEDGNLVIEWDYVKELFPPDFIKNMHHAYCQLLYRLVSDSQSWKENRFDLRPEAQKIKHIQVNSTHWQLPSEKLINERFYQEVEKHPDHPAVIANDKTLSYRELDRIANQVAHYFRSKKVLPNQLIAVILEKGWEQVVSCLGILTAGAAYLPIDPDLPDYRMNELLTIAGVSGVILKEKRDLSNLSYLQRIPSNHILFLDDPSLQNYSKERLNTIQTKDDLAYVIFTSGSTGIPKGVMIKHNAVLNTLLDLNDHYQVNEQDRVLAISNLNFDLSVYDIFGLLIAGGTIVFPDPACKKDPQHWLDLILRHKVTLWNSVPMFMQMLMNMMDQHSVMTSLRLILLSGDWIPVDLPAKIRKTLIHTHLRIISLGGATEASIWSISYEIQNTEKFVKSIPYGKPLRNQQFYVLNHRLGYCPDWVVGELYIGGNGLAEGYLKNEEKTKESFILHHDLGRLYKTGDLGRWLPDSQIEFLGRADFQIKIGGHRIELEEISAILNKHEDVSQSFVTTFSDELNNKQLVAYVIPHHSSLPVSTEPTVARAEFKFAQRGLRRFSQETYTISLQREFSEDLEKRYFARKSYRTFAGDHLDKQQLQNWLKETKEDLNLSLELSNLLSPFACLKVKEHILPKYLYPSAGSLYPVQLYIRHTIGEEELFSYYDPSCHDLKVVLKRPYSSTKGIDLIFVAHLPAIQPLYGELSQDFCYLETGYMLGLLPKGSFLASEQSQSLSSLLSLQTQDVITHIAHIQPNEQSKEIISFDLILYIKPEKIEDLKGGWYFYHPHLQTFEFITEDDPFHLSPETEENYAIEREAWGVLLFMGHHDEKSCLIEIGALSQSIMEKGIELGIGTCALGYLDTRLREKVSKIFPNTHFMHGLFFGPVTMDQMRQRMPSQAIEGVFMEEIKGHVSQHLPKYMIPSSFFMVEHFPLSINGKIDQKALPKPTTRIKNKKVTLPRNELEKQFLLIWASALQLSQDAICIFDHFFDLGGNSLLLIQIYNQTNAFLNRWIPIDKYFQYPSIHAFAEFIQKDQALELNQEEMERQANKKRQRQLTQKRNRTNDE